MSKPCYWVYMLECSNGHYYTGYTNNIDKRYAAHLSGTASKYTRAFKPISIAQSWKIENGKSMAMQIEHQIKRLSRAEKERIIKNPDLIYALLR